MTTVQLATKWMNMSQMLPLSFRRSAPKGLTREEFCEPSKQNVEYWGRIERGEQPISFGELLQVCEAYSSPSWKLHRRII